MTTNRRRAATIPDVAREAGVSRSTASRALADYGSVSPETRERVRAAAEKLGYRANQLARSMITGRTHTLGVVIADIQNPFFAGVTRGITDAAHAAGYQVLLANTDEDLGAERAAVKTLCDKHVDGLVVAPASTTEIGHLAALVEGVCPVVLLDRHAPSLATDAVTVDNQGASEDAVRRLIAAGHRRIALVTLVGSEPHRGAEDEADAQNGAGADDGGGAGNGTGPGDGSGTGNGTGPDGGSGTGNGTGPGDGSGTGNGTGPGTGGAPPGPSPISTGVERVAGYRAALRAAGVEDTDAYLRVGTFHRQDPAALTEELLSLPEPPTAVFATDSMIALGVLSAVNARGLRVPEDISVVAFDDAEWTRVVRPRLSVVAQPVQELGAEAVRALLTRIETGARPPRHITLDTTFITRDSIAPPR
ncbi:LacI family DNA-binding transcriptional regulator [Streptomyces sp. PRKS01-29]|nr:LacI family DNA-binding transcriptional regulator [Streptomyces sabulosicollis]MBI0297212.1 LacI family DNA-binding transcriptional regulator [Streptomyces sabulosicollis]